MVHDLVSACLGLQHGVVQVAVVGRSAGNIKRRGGKVSFQLTSEIDGCGRLYGSWSAGGAAHA